ncbi:SAM-dependent methyltransferase [Bordetella petrii]|uniref:SAM-dependent methyltransferase n=1 Tax=Bordetella petrii TaxID=94624 RepID=UPI001E438340|nr:class I SAM-dependent methyltransferase [Bordetella petrii]MCD0504803.1 class I SAM-dependent methyltransferase [Bordetella petrii]
MRTLQKTLVSAVLCTLAWHGGAIAQSPNPATTASYEPTVGQSGKDVVWVPTPQTLVDRMLDLAALTPQDRLVDLGSGDGRTVITAAKRGAVARGIEFNPDMVALARGAAQAEGVADRASFEQADIFQSDFSEATVITLFLLPRLNERLRPTLLDMKPGTRVVSNSFTMGDWQPDESVQVTDQCSAYCHAYKWVVPAKVAGNWKLGDQELVLEQTYQMLSGSMRNGSAATPISDARLDGDTIHFTVGTQRYTGRVSGDAMQGSTAGNATWQASRASR